jgi:hypothetical protein
MAHASINRHSPAPHNPSHWLGQGKNVPG